MYLTDKLLTGFFDKVLSNFTRIFLPKWGFHEIGTCSSELLLSAGLLLTLRPECAAPPSLS
jgi:hypothetical protein